MLNPVLKLENVNKRLSDLFALKNISIDIFKGEVHAIIGENGSGKSSLMNIILGMYTKDTGNIYIDGALAYINSPIDAKKLGISMIHQVSSLFDHLTVTENVYIGNESFSNKTLKIINWEKMYEDCQNLFNKLGFKINSKTLLRNLNIAQKQLVEICKAYISNAKIIIMDEPTSCLTESETSMLFYIINELKKSGVAIIYISHKLEEIKQICDKVTIMKNGKIIATQTTKNMNITNIINLINGSDLKDNYPKLNIKIGKDVLTVKNLCCNNTLKDINFNLKEREILGIIGLVGSGRTKIAKTIFGIDKFDSGEIYVNNKKLNLSSPEDAIKAKIGYITEDRVEDGLFMYLNIAENITAPNISKVSSKYIIDKEIERNIANSYMKRLGITGGHLNDKVSNLSGGNQQKVILAKWIMSKSKILIMDEPTKGIDVATKVDVYNLMNEMVTKNVSIILISSDTNEVIGMCDRIIVLYNGKIATILSKKEATREKIMFYATGGK